MAALAVIRFRRISHSLPCFGSTEVVSRQAPGLPVAILTASQFMPIEGAPPYATARGPISRIPNEALGEIFCILRAQLRRRDGWVCILQVCRHWFAVAKSLSELWTRISSRQSLASLYRFLLYSKFRPLEVEIYPKERADISELLLAIGSGAGRIEKLSATFSWCEDFHAAISCIFSQMPVLRDVSMKITHPYPLGDHPRTFSIDACHTIQSLRLVNINVAFKRNNPLHLTKLTLENITGLPSLTTLVDVLRAAPALESVELSGGCPLNLLQGDLDIQTSADNLPIHLPNLKRMILRTEPEFPNVLLSMVATPPTADIMICLPVISLRCVPSSFLCEALPLPDRLANIGSLSRVNGLSIRFHGPAPSLIGFHIDKESCKPLFSLMVIETTYPPGKTPFQHIVDSIAGAIEVLGFGDHVTSVEVMGHKPEEGFSEAQLDLSNMLYALPKLTGLSLRVSGLPNVLAALASERSDENGRHGIVCPNLGEMQWQDIQIDDDVVVNIMDCFERRKELGATLMKYLRIFGSLGRGLRVEHVNMLEGVVKRLKCCG